MSDKLATSSFVSTTATPFRSGQDLLDEHDTIDLPVYVVPKSIAITNRELPLSVGAFLVAGGRVAADWIDCGLGGKGGLGLSASGGLDLSGSSGFGNELSGGEYSSANRSPCGNSSSRVAV